MKSLSERLHPQKQKTMEDIGTAEAATTGATHGPPKVFEVMLNSQTDDPETKTTGKNPMVPSSSKRAREGDGGEEKYEKVVLEEREKLSEVEYKNLVAHAKKLGRKLEQLLKTRERMKKLDERIMDITKGYIPAGCKPFTIPDIPENDLPVCLPYFQVQFGKEWSIRQAREAVYRANLEFIQRCDAKVAEYQETKLRKEVAYQTFIDSVSATVEEKTKLIHELQIDLPPGLFEEKPAVSKTKATEFYKKIVSLAAESIAEQRTKLEQEKKMEAQEVKKLNEMSDENLFQKAVEQAVKKYKGKGQGKGYGKSDDKTIDTKKVDVDFVGAFLEKDSFDHSNKVQKKRRYTKSQLSELKENKGSQKEERQKHYPSPAGGLGQNQYPKGKSKGKGKYNQKLIWSQKGKGQTSLKGKGKGKSYTMKGKGKGKYTQKTTFQKSKGKGKGKGKNDKRFGGQKGKMKGKQENKYPWKQEQQKSFWF